MLSISSFSVPELLPPGAGQLRLAAVRQLSAPEGRRVAGLQRRHLAVRRRGLRGLPKVRTSELHIIFCVDFSLEFVF